MTSDAPLDGVKVVELSMYVQGPVAGLTLAALGAEVVKIEQVGTEDHMRNFKSVFGVTFDDDGRDWLYASLNRNKKALALDITSEQGREVFTRLIVDADVFVTNMREAALVRQGADPETLLDANPRLVYCRGAGFGVGGPLADDPCQDTVGMAYSGFMDTTSPDGTPNYPPGSMSDILTGTNMASGIMAGLLKRARTGEGCVIGTSQVQSMLWLQSQNIGITANLGQRPERFAPDGTTNPMFTVYRTADGWIAIAVLQGPQWPPVAEALGLGHLLDDERFATLGAITEHRDAFRPIVAAHLRTEPTGHWWAILRRAGAWVAPVNRLEDLADDEHIWANEYLIRFDDGWIGPPGPFDVDGFKGARGEAAHYGQHTDEVLAALGYDDAEVLNLRAGGAVW
ncbi:MAG: CoA transferase [Actinomycetota bacterium]